MTPDVTQPSRPPISDALISVVLPVGNNSAVLVSLCQRLRMALAACRTTYEIIFVDDGSTDGSAAIVDHLAQQFADIRVVHLSRTFGDQAAIHAGLAHANGDAVVIMAADMQNPPEVIGELLVAWQAGSEVVYAVGTPRKQPLWKRTVRAGLRRLRSPRSRDAISNHSENFGLIDARVVKLMLALAERDRYFPGLRNWVGFKQTEVPYNSKSEYRRRRSLRAAAHSIKSAVFSASTAPLAIFAWLGGFAVLAFLATGGYAACSLLRGSAAPAAISYSMTVSFFAALNALGIVVLGEYLVRIYDQVRGMPSYIVDRTVNFAAAESDGLDENVSQSTTAAGSQSGAIDLEQLDPLQLGGGWDDTYQHLLVQAQDLIELGALARSEADDLAERQTRTASAVNEVFQETVGACDEPRLLKLPDATPRR